MITERTLKKWRKEALKANVGLDPNSIPRDGLITVINELAERILRMSQELLDQYLMRRD